MPSVFTEPEALASIGRYHYPQPQHLVDAVTLFRCEVVQGLQDHSRVVLQEGIGVVLYARFAPCDS